MDSERQINFQVTVEVAGVRRRLATIIGRSKGEIQIIIPTSRYYVDRGVAQSVERDNFIHVEGHKISIHASDSSAEQINVIKQSVKLENKKNDWTPISYQFTKAIKQNGNFCPVYFSLCSGLVLGKSQHDVHNWKLEDVNFPDVTDGKWILCWSIFASNGKVTLNSLRYRENCLAISRSVSRYNLTFICSFIPIEGYLGGHHCTGKTVDFLPENEYLRTLSDQTAEGVDDNMVAATHLDFVLDGRQRVISDILSGIVEYKQAWSDHFEQTSGDEFIFDRPKSLKLSKLHSKLPLIMS